MNEYPKVGDKVVSKQPESPARVVVTKVENGLIEIRTADGACGSHMGVEKFNSDYRKVE